MRYLRTNTACRITVGPFFDKTDGVTPETALTVTACKLTLMVDNADVPTLVLDTNPTASGGSNDMVHVTGDDAGFYDLELAAANVNYLGRAMLALTDAATHCPVFHEFMILPAVVYDSLVLGTDSLQVDTVQVAGNTTAVTNLANQYSVLETGTAQAGAASTITLRSGASAVNDFYKDQVVFIISGTGAVQTNRITGYVGATKVATVGTAWVTQPNNTSVYQVLGRVG